jgi:hypothetical protein
MIAFITTWILAQQHRQFVVDKLKITLALSRHSGMLLAGIHHYQRPKIWIPAKSMPE